MPTVCFASTLGASAPGCVTASTRASGDRDRPAEQAAEMLGVPGKVVTLKQVHSDLVFPADGAISGDEPRTEGDGLTSATASETIGVRIADCLPLLLVDPERRAVAAVHAGWRGSAARIAALAVEAMNRSYGSRPGDLEAVIGPCISAEQYEVGQEVASHFDAGAVLREGRAKPHVDLAAANRLQLLASGLREENIHGGVHCSFSEAERFHSHRRDGACAGRMLAFIGLR
ncbi:MAG: peptidoglycan editing factor PgeF [Bryobacterales bacterium]